MSETKHKLKKKQIWVSEQVQFRLHEIQSQVTLKTKGKRKPSYDDVIRSLLEAELDLAKLQLDTSDLLLWNKDLDTSYRSLNIE